MTTRIWIIDFECSRIFSVDYTDELYQFLNQFVFIKEIDALRTLIKYKEIIGGLRQ